MRLLESGLQAAVDFLAAADRTTHARQGLDGATISLEGAKSSDQQTYDHYRVQWEEARESAQAAVAEAENAYAALRMLVPAAADQARRYQDFCIQAVAHPDETKVDRQRARQMVEETLRQELGGDPPAQEIMQRRWWQLPGRSRAAGMKAPRQPGGLTGRFVSAG
jgi:hypothetical protein